MKKLFKNPIKTNLLCMLIFPVIFIIPEIFKLRSEDLKAMLDFVLVIFTYPIIIISECLGINLNSFFKFFFNYEHIFAFTACFILLCLGIMAYRIGRKNNLKLYKRIAVTVYAIWLFLFLIVFAEILMLFFMEVNVNYVIILSITFALILLYFFIVIGIIKTASIKSFEQPKEKENEEIS
ncbi:MAG: hypothetical protein E7508_07130 [Ruminococcus sp.]|nr:hypothetical protein [Ruminococcus sp.]